MKDVDQLSGHEVDMHVRLLVWRYLSRYLYLPVPFEEDDKDPSIWFLDHNYHEAMFSMFKRINDKEHVVGWYRPKTAGK
ncbi:26S proteasome non-ATPase regulatory subunit 7 homolog A-like [Macadamia integrifolia]|uniref:26S proteasome non-ATPase regulatory subunit 7 homolog A-like n=1 Tax=Macadamia integrifolia TaxID=60698 RepID=UPI001C4FE1A0|nr:26S proteasome non-ATPase regulatory subunit 7 homolog A-like [Macadamia integrifolia]